MFDPERFEKDRSLIAPDSPELALRLASKLNIFEGCSVLDYGCGAGSVTFKYLLPTVKEGKGRVVGVDISKQMIDYAKRNYADNDISYHVGNIMDNSAFLLGENFDNVFSFYVMNHIWNSEKFIKNVWSVLNPGGVFSFSTVICGAQFRILEILKKKSKWENFVENSKNHIPSWIRSDNCPAKALQNALNTAGFEVLEFVQETRPYMHDKMDMYSSYLMSLNPMLDGLPEESKVELELEYRNILSEKKSDGDTGLFSKDIVHCVAKKPRKL